LWYACQCSEQSGVPIGDELCFGTILNKFDIWAWNAQDTLMTGGPYPGESWDLASDLSQDRFCVFAKGTNPDVYCIDDLALELCVEIPAECLQNQKFDLVNWYTKRVIKSYQHLEGKMFPPDPNVDVITEYLYFPPAPDHSINLAHDAKMVCIWASAIVCVQLEEHATHFNVLQLNGQQVKAGTYPAIKRNAA
jgi:hypothetical protein